MEAALRERAGLIEHQRPGLRQRLQIVAALDQDALAGCPAQAAEEAERDIAYDPEPIGRYNVAQGLKFCS